MFGIRPSKSLHIMQNMNELAAFARGAAGLNSVTSANRKDAPQ